MAGIFGGAGLLIFLVSIHYLVNGLIGALFGLLFGAVWMIAGFGQYFRINRFERRNFDWYRHKHPQSYGANGRVSCAKCNGKHIRVRGLMQRSYTREHFCGTCGTTLYYTPEG
ncbi:hypothetical protein [Achromobacter insuavis]|uniref:hypothetical protein n=1 Tax=Achromobacter insuavis TaxID=1287735 RepID=UPI0015D25E6A|nr:hypothetical protein [Achromobacter insuavis]